MVDTAQALYGNIAGPLIPGDEAEQPHAALRQDFAAGLVSGEHVHVVTAVLDALPPGLSEATTVEAEGELVKQARQHDPKVLTQIGKHLRHVLEREGADTLADEEERDFARRRFDIRR